MDEPFRHEPLPSARNNPTPQIKAKVGAWVSLTWLTGSIVAVAIGLYSISDDTVTDMRLALAVVLAGAGAAALQGSLALVTYMGNRVYRSSWTPYYLFRPLLGGITALWVYVFLRAFFVSSTTSVSSLNYYGIVAIAFTAGIFSRSVLAALTRVYDTILDRLAGRQSRRGDSLRPPTDALPVLDRYRGYFVHELKAVPDSNQQTLRVWLQAEEPTDTPSTLVDVGEEPTPPRVLFEVNVFAVGCDVEPTGGKLQALRDELVSNSLTFVLRYPNGVDETSAFVELAQRGRTVAVAEISRAPAVAEAPGSVAHQRRGP